jgi:hypothetical protein
MNMQQTYQSARKRKIREREYIGPALPTDCQGRCQTALKNPGARSACVTANEHNRIEIAGEHAFEAAGSDVRDAIVDDRPL